jgi:four helix bundle protein
LKDGPDAGLSFNFEKLDVWGRAVALADLAYRVTREFPDAERFGLTSQLRRAAVSVSANIAEGSSRASRGEFARFVEIATGSLFEVVSLAKVANRQGFLPDAAYQEIYAAAAEQVRMLSGLRRSLLG